MLLYIRKFNFEKKFCQNLVIKEWKSILIVYIELLQMLKYDLRMDQKTSERTVTGVFGVLLEKKRASQYLQSRNRKMRPNDPTSSSSV